jgi:hypothetical protein
MIDLFSRLQRSDSYNRNVDYAHIDKAIACTSYTDCPTKSDRSVPRKCTLCYGNHEAWSRQCSTRIKETAKAKIAYKTRPRYHHKIETRERAVQVETPATVLQVTHPLYWEAHMPNTGISSCFDRHNPYTTRHPSPLYLSQD